MAVEAALSAEALFAFATLRVTDGAGEARGKLLVAEDGHGHTLVGVLHQRRVELGTPRPRRGPEVRLREVGCDRSHVGVEDGTLRRVVERARARNVARPASALDVEEVTARVPSLEGLDPRRRTFVVWFDAEETEQSKEVLVGPRVFVGYREELIDRADERRVGEASPAIRDCFRVADARLCVPEHDEPMPWSLGEEPVQLVGEEHHGLGRERRAGQEVARRQRVGGRRRTDQYSMLAIGCDVERFRRRVGDAQVGARRLEAGLHDYIARVGEA